MRPWPVSGQLLTVAATGRRSAQVFANGAFGTLAALGAALASPSGSVSCIAYGADVPDAVRLAGAMACAFLGHYACCTGDTWASELGPLSRAVPRLITTGRRVPAGTNGGVTLAGTLASALGGAGCGLTMWAAIRLTAQPPCAASQAALVPLGLAAGLMGSALDSVLGALLQASYYDAQQQRIVPRPSGTARHVSGLDVLDNHQVNFLSSLLTGLGAAYVSQWLF